MQVKLLHDLVEEMAGLDTGRIVDILFGKVKEVKSKEEEELKGWSEDIEKIKTRLSEVDSEVFSQI